jgi:alpha-L-rhamnosidase
MNNVLSDLPWISSSHLGGPRSSAPVPYFRKTFRLDHAVASARLTVTALGLYDVEINGQRVGDQIFSPGWMDYHVRVPVQTHDVTGLLRKGDNAIGGILGDGWYCGHVAWLGRQNYGDKPEFLAALEVDFEDGTSLVVGTDGSWKTVSGPILESDFLMGETYDARRELGAWSLPEYDDSAWGPVQINTNRKIILDALSYPPVKKLGEISPSRLDSGIYDMGQNFSGRVRLRVKAPRGTTLTVCHAEILNPDGSLYTDNLREARATDFYTCKGGDTETWEPRFTFHGFRYVGVQGLPREGFLEVTGIVLSSDTPPTGMFSCSHPLLNQLQQNIVWGQKSNFLEVPTDCPQRDERLGWTGDAQVFIRTAAFNMDVRRFFHKWMQDMRDAQGANGAVPSVVPAGKFTSVEDGGPAWADAIIICPWTVYLCYGDKKILEDHYDAMRRFLDFIAQQRCRNHIRSHPEVDAWGGYGDWLALDGSGKVDGATPKDLIGTAFYAHDVKIMGQVAGLLGRDEDAAMFRVLHRKIVEAFRHRFVTPEGFLASGTQTAYVLALHFGLLPEELRPTAARELVRDIEKRKDHIATGFVGTPYILDVLEENGFLDVAYRLLEQETFPSWLFPVKNGATTIWERWDGWTPEKGFQDKRMNSFNHYAYGAVGAWMYRSVAGLELDAEEPGYRHIIFRPRPGGSITSAKAELQTPQGPAGISWRLDGKNLVVETFVPEGARASFSPPSGYVPETAEWGAGRHRIVLTAS